MSSTEAPPSTIDEAAHHSTSTTPKFLGTRYLTSQSTTYFISSSTQSQASQLLPYVTSSTAFTPNTTSSSLQMCQWGWSIHNACKERKTFKPGSHRFRDYLYAPFCMEYQRKGSVVCDDPGESTNDFNNTVKHKTIGKTQVPSTTCEECIKNIAQEVVNK